eukprot:768351-Hanusia_phi.AAC.8
MKTSLQIPNLVEVRKFRIGSCNGEAAAYQSGQFLVIDFRCSAILIAVYEEWLKIKLPPSA